MATVMGAVGGLALVGPQCRDARHAEGRVHGRGHPLGPRRGLFTAGGHLVHMHQPFGAPPA